MTLTSDNAQDAGADVLTTSFDIAVGGVGFDTPGKPTGVGGRGWGAMLALRDAIRRTHAEQSVNPLDHDDDSGTCEDGGTIAVTHDDVDGSNDTSTGDSYAYTFTSCTFATIVVNGTLHLSITSLTGVFEDAEYSLTGTLTVDVSIQAAGETFDIEGALTGTVAETSDTLAVDFSANGLEFVGGDGTVVLTATLHYDDDFFGDYSFSTNGSLVSEELGGSVTWTTTVPFTGPSGEWPSQGVVVIQGGGGTSVKITALSSVMVQFEVDSNGDGIVDDTFQAPWDALGD